MSTRLSYLTNYSQSNGFKALAWLLQFSALAALLIYQQLTNPLALNSDISAIFVSEKSSPLAAITTQIEQRATRSQIVLVGAPDLNGAISAADKLARQLRTIIGIATVNVIFDQLPTLSQLINQHLGAKHLLLSDHYVKLLAAGDSEALFRYQFSLLNQVGNQAVALSVQADPSLSIADYFSRSVIASSGLSPQQNHLVAQYQNKHYVFISFQTEQSGIDIKSSQALVAHLTQLALQPNFEYLYTGAIFYASAASETGQFEMTLYGGLSLLAMLLMIGIVYRSGVAIGLTLTLIGVSFLYGYLGLSLFYDEISVIALVFSVTLIGISADYSFHALTELKYGNGQPQQPLRAITSSLVMSYLTTGAGYLVLLLAPFVLFKQIAIFTIFGLFGALVTVLLLYPLLQRYFKQGNSEITPNIIKLNQWHQRFSRRFSLTKHLALPLLILLGTAAYISDFNDDIRDFYAVAPAIKANEDKVQSILKQKWQMQYLLIAASSPQALLEREELALKQLKPLIEQGVLSHYSAISQWLPSQQQQLANLELMTQAQEQGMFNRLTSMLGQPLIINNLQQSLLPNKWFETALGRMFSNQWLAIDQQYYSVVRLAGITDVSVINQTFSANQQINFIDKASEISAQVQQFRQLLIWVLVAAVLAALVVFCLRYNIAIALRAIVSPVVALLIALALSSLIEQQLNIFNLVAGVLILALGLDYSVFFAEHGFERKITLTTLMSALSSIFVFAILMFSSMPAIRSFGLTVFIGVLVVFVLAPQVIKARSL